MRCWTELNQVITNQNIFFMIFVVSKCEPTVLWHHNQVQNKIFIVLFTT